MRITRIIIAAIAAAALPAIASAAALTLTVDNIEKSEGTLRVGIFNADGYEAGDAVNGANITVDGDTVSATIEGLEPGEYAVKLFHDLNDDEQMATNPFGMPTEPYAFSNNARGRFGPATWDDAKFEIATDGAAHTITMK